MTIFYIGLNPRWQNYTFLPDRLNVMYSSAGFWDGYEWRKGKFITKGLRFLDSGGFTMLNKHGDYPWSIDEYMNLVAKLRPNYYASMDYPCEPEISRKMSFRTNRERIEATVRNSKLIDEWSNHVSGLQLPVIQGYTLDEYKHCIDRYADTGMIREYMAVGSMCRRINTSELMALIPGISEYAKQAGVNKLHWFGLKLDPRLVEVSEYIYSRDSAVSMDAYDPELRRQREGRRWPRGQVEKKDAMMSFLNRVEQLGLTTRSIV